MVVPVLDVDGLVVAVRAHRVEGVHNLWHLLLVLPRALVALPDGHGRHLHGVPARRVHRRQQIHRRVRRRSGPGRLGRRLVLGDYVVPAETKGKRLPKYEYGSCTYSIRESQ